MIALTFTVIQVNKVTGTFRGGKKLITSQYGLMYFVCFERGKGKGSTSVQIIQM
jgi:hypothetical protein